MSRVGRRPRFGLWGGVTVLGRWGIGGVGVTPSVRICARVDVIGFGPVGEGEGVCAPAAANVDVAS